MPIRNAKEILKEHWDGTLPVDPVKIATKMGIAVQASPFFENESGHYSPNGCNGGPLISFNPGEAYVRQRFTVAHEIGHHALGHGDRPRDTPKQYVKNSSDPAEREANRFAAELLMPESAVHALIRVRGIKDVAKLASMFVVSRTAMLFRLEKLGYAIK